MVKRVLELSSKNLVAVHWYEVQILWNASTNVFCIELGENQSGNHDYTAFGGLINNAGTGKDGDVLFTTVGHTSADTYTIIMSMRKEYG